jgi:hypothetical protein
MAEQKKGNGKQDEDNPEFRNFQQLLKQVLSVPKEKIDEKRTEYQRQRKEKRTG